MSSRFFFWLVCGVAYGAVADHSLASSLRQVVSSELPPGLLVANRSVRRAPLPEPALIGSPNGRSLRVDREPSASSDEELERRVEKELHSNPFVHAEQIRVHVQRGVVTLTGVTKSEHGYRAAAATAARAGALRVRNLIHIEP